MRKAGGILTIIGGCIGIGLGAAIISFGEISGMLKGLMWFGAIGGPLIGIGIVALIGGTYALRARAWGFALAGAILAIITGGPFGVLSTIFIAVRKGEFE